MLKNFKLHLGALWWLWMERHSRHCQKCVLFLNQEILHIKQANITRERNIQSSAVRSNRTPFLFKKKRETLKVYNSFNLKH